MCGVIGYLGKKPIPIILDGLRRLQYRGYDSAGLLVLGKNVYCRKTSGKIERLEKLVSKNIDGQVALGHTRWATHGIPNTRNAHPHWDCDKNIFLVHNGIIENYQEHKKDLLKKNHKFSSDTDTEVVAHLIEEILKSKRTTFEEAVRLALQKIVGTYALLIASAKEPNKLIIARNSSPLVLGKGEKEYYVASDVSAILPHTKEVVYLNDGEFGIVTSQGFRIATIDRKPVNKKTEQIEWSLEEIQKQGFSHFMLKEIFEEPGVVENAIRGRLILGDGSAKLGGIESVKDKLQDIDRLIIAACGTAFLAGLVGEYMIEDNVGLPVEVEYASEFRYRKPVLDKKTGFLVISQSGETADSLAALREVKSRGLLTLGIVNVIGSTISRQTDAGIYNHAGPEIGVASTKAFVSQLAVLVLLTLFLGRQRSMPKSLGKAIAEELLRIPSKMRLILKKESDIKKLAKKYYKFNNFLYLGRRYNMPIAYEGALKLKEISYIHAEGYGAGEMKHGPIAMIDKNFPSLFIIPSPSFVYEKIINNIEEIRSRKGPVIAIATIGDRKIRQLADDVIYIPKTIEMLTPLLTILPLQLFAYYIGVLRGYDVDKPRNLAKSVTVE